MTWYDNSLNQMADQLFSADISVAAYPLVFFGGLVTNFCPCNIALVPMVIGYAGGFSRSRERARTLLYSALFSSGIVLTLCVLGGLVSLAGATFTPARTVCLWAISLISVIMGLHRLGALTFPLPGLTELPAWKRKGPWSAFVLGLIAGVIATPCTTPVLAVILAYVAVKARLLYGLSLLFAYAVGFIVPLLLAGAFTDFILHLERLQKKTRYRNWIAQGSGWLLIMFGLYVLKIALWSKIKGCC